MILCFELLPFAGLPLFKIGDTELVVFGRLRLLIDTLPVPFPAADPVVGGTLALKLNCPASAMGQSGDIANIKRPKTTVDDLQNVIMAFLIR